MGLENGLFLELLLEPIWEYTESPSTDTSLDSKLTALDVLSSSVFKLWDLGNSSSAKFKLENSVDSKLPNMLEEAKEDTELGKLYKLKVELNKTFSVPRNQFIIEVDKSAKE